MKNGRFPLSLTQRVDTDETDKDSDSPCFEGPGVFSCPG